MKVLAEEIQEALRRGCEAASEAARETVPLAMGPRLVRGGSLRDNIEANNQRQVEQARAAEHIIQRPSIKRVTFEDAIGDETKCFDRVSREGAARERRPTASKQWHAMRLQF